VNVEEWLIIIVLAYMGKTVDSKILGEPKPKKTYEIYT
jgi:hypothetical protein